MYSAYNETPIETLCCSVAYNACIVSLCPVIECIYMYMCTLYMYVYSDNTVKMYMYAKTYPIVNCPIRFC